MKHFVIIISGIFIAAFLLIGIFYVGGAYIKMGDETLSADVRAQDQKIQIKTSDGTWENFEVRGVNLGSSLPGEWATDYAIDKETYLRWFEQIQEMGANVIRVYAVQNPSFYQAFADFNSNEETPLYLLQGIWVNDYVQNSRMDAYELQFRGRLMEDCKATVDVVHGKRFLLSNTSNGSNGVFLTDVSRWVLGYIIGGEWMDVTVAYTDEKYPDHSGYQGEFLYTAQGASAFEALLTEVGNQLIAYESLKYARQHPVSFANGRTTDPFSYPEEICEFFRKCASINIENICASDAFGAGLFASYSVYSYDMDYLSLMEREQWDTLIDAPVDFTGCEGTEGSPNTYLAYLKLLNAHHTVPVVITEFGGATGRGLAQYNTASRLQEGHFSEEEQEKSIVRCYQDIEASGCAGGLVYGWQDEWNKRTWNTMFGVDLSRNVYWSDAQSSNQHFGLLAFDPGEESTCIVDGDVSEWTEGDVVKEYQDGSSISMKYDERYVYLRIFKPGYRFGEEVLYVPIDTTQKTGASICAEYGLTFDKGVDFLLKIHSTEDSVLLVQDRYHGMYANYMAEVNGGDAYIDPPAKASPHFEVASMAVKNIARQYNEIPAMLDSYETGRLCYGNADPGSPDYNSLTDFIASGDHVEIRIPWGLLNFGDPSRMQIHDDYYDGNYGVEFIPLKEISLGLGDGSRMIHTGTVSLKGWGNDVACHERLKSAYYGLQDCWTGGDGS